MAGKDPVRAGRAARRAHPALIVLSGLSGSGKSTLARALARRTGYTQITSDVVRKRLAGVPLDTRPTAGAPNLYTAELSRRTYDTMFDQARRELAAGGGVILDGTFQLRAGRTVAREIARHAGVPFVLVECRCPSAEIERRLRKRTRAGTDASDADWPVFLEQRHRFEAFDPDDEGDRLILDMVADPEGLARQVEARLR